MSEPSDLPVSSLRRLARGLLYDDARADDVVQEAWLAALRRGPSPAGLRAWLAEAVRRIARSAGRDELRRAAREERAARPEALPSAAEASARIEILRRLVDAVDALDEPYRSAVVLRYFDELPPRAIAKRLGIPVNTARTHVRRGLERLRRQLDGERGQGREELLAALAPFVGGPPWSLLPGRPPLGSPSPAEIGVLLMKSPIVIASAVVLCTGAWWFLRGAGGRTAAPRVARSEERVGVELAGSNDRADRARAELEDVDATGTRESVNDAPRVESGWVVHGQLFRGRRQPYPHGELVGRVYAGPEPEGTPILEQRLRADEHGAYLWSLAPPAELVAIRVETAPESPFTDSYFDLFRPGDAPPEPWDLTAFPIDGVLRGAVRARGGAPVPGARIVYQRHGTVREVQSGAEGRYELPTSSARGYVELMVLAAGFAITSDSLGGLNPGERTHDVTLDREQRLPGRVVDGHAAPIEGALVSATFPTELAGVRTDAEGRFELGWLDDGTGVHGPATITVEKTGYLTSSTRQPSPGTEVEIVLARGTTISGRVLAPDRSPVAGCQVSDGYGARPSNVTCSDAEGRFGLAPTFPGKRELWLWRRGFAQLRFDVDVPEGAASVDGVEIVLAEPHHLGGIVLDPAGEPVPWAWVYVASDVEDESGRAQGFSTHADAEGRFRIEGLPDVPMRLGLREDGCAPLEHPVTELDRDDLVLRLTGPSGLAGLVLDDATGAPIPAFTVKVARAEPPFERSSIENGRTFTDPAGVWRTDETFPVGRAFTVEVRAQGYVANTARVVASVERDPVACVVRLKRGARVHGRVVERATQRPVAGALVSHASYRDHSGLGFTPLVTSTDERGEFELPDVPPGGMALRVEAAEGGAMDGPFQVQSGEPVERWIELCAGGSLEGRLLDANGVGVAGATVKLDGRYATGPTHWWSTTSAADGAYSFAELPPGIFELFWLREQDGQRVRDLETLVVLEEGVNRIDLRPRGATTLRGTVRLEDGSTLPVSALYLHQPRKEPWGFSDGMRGTIVRNGTFEVPGLEAGSWNVGAFHHSPGGKSVAGTLELEVRGEETLEAHLVMRALQ